MLTFADSPLGGNKNQSLRERLNMPKNNSAGASRIISDAVEAGLIKISDKAPESKKYSSYVPYYA